MQAPALYTAGYEGLNLDAFLARLREADIRLLVDVRERPQSRKPGFSRTALAQALESAGIAYRHERALGCPQPIRERYRQDGDWSRYTREFLAWLQGQDDAIERLASEQRRQRCALLCYEADPLRCHRLFVAQAVARRTGAEVVHLGA